MLRFSFPRLAVICAASFLAALSGAQSPSLNEVAYNLSSPALQAELSLGASTKTEIAKILRAYDQEQQAVYKSSRNGSGQDRLDKLESEYAAKLLAAVSATQRARIEQIA